MYFIGMLRNISVAKSKNPPHQPLNSLHLVECYREKSCTFIRFTFLEKKVVKRLDFYFNKATDPLQISVIPNLGLCVACAPNQRACDETYCIQNDHWCDGVINCPMGQDEGDAACNPG